MGLSLLVEPVCVEKERAACLAAGAAGLAGYRSRRLHGRYRPAGGVAIWGRAALCGQERFPGGLHPVSPIQL
ncbi:hypothetical protein D3C76_1495540 [compost metagenome]